MPKQWENDFRYPAIQASMQLAEDYLDRELFDYPFSFCLPVAGKPVGRWITPNRISLVFVMLGLAGLIGGAVTISIFDQNHRHADVWLLVGSGFSLSGFAFLFFPLLFANRLTSWCIGQRGKALLQSPQGGDVICCELGNAENPTLSIDGDDNVLILLDPRHQRLLIEGVGATYQIFAKDVVSITPFGFMNYLGADITYRINDTTTLRVGMAKVSLLRELGQQNSLLFFLEHWVRNKILEDITATLGIGSLEHLTQPDELSD